jgi:hypothetical protein
MINAVRRKLSYSNVVATIALFIALGGAAVAAGLPKRSVGPQQLKLGAVTTQALHRGAVTNHKLALGAVTGGKLAANSVSVGALQNGSVNAAKLAKNSVTSQAITTGVVGTSKLGNGAVTTGKLANGSVTAAKLDDTVAPLLGTLRTGQTLRGAFNVGAFAAGAEETAHGGLSYQFPLATAPTANVVDLVANPNGVTASCPGLSGGNQQTPQAAAGQLCVYITGKTNLDGTAPFATENGTRLGSGLVAKSAATGDFLVSGLWAVTAP